MSLANSKLVSLTYGADSRFSLELDTDRIVASPATPQPNAAFLDDLKRALVHPLDFPPLEQSLIPGDKVTLAVDRGVPHAAALIAAVWPALAKRGVDPQDVTIIQPAGLSGEKLRDPRAELPPDVRQHVFWKVHDPADIKNCPYLATTASGERVYLAREVVDADVVLTIGQIAYDPLVGYRGTNSVFYPGLSTAEAIRRSRGMGHSELEPDDFRPLRQTIDEVGWLLGTQFSIQVIPSAGNGIFQVIAGATESVLRRGVEVLAEQWLIRLESRPEIVVVAVENNSEGQTWQQVAAAVAAARSLVAMGGKVLVLSELDAELGPGFELLRRCNSPREALKPLKELDPDDFVEAAQFAHAADWANIYLMSKLNPDVVEDLFMIPVESHAEAARLLSGDESCLFVGSAQFAFGLIDSK